MNAYDDILARAMLAAGIAAIGPPGVPDSEGKVHDESTCVFFADELQVKAAVDTVIRFIGEIADEARVGGGQPPLPHHRHAFKPGADPRMAGTCVQCGKPALTHDD